MNGCEGTSEMPTETGWQIFSQNVALADLWIESARLLEGLWKEEKEYHNGS
jgi:hypothetical protein